MLPFLTTSKLFIGNIKKIKKYFTNSLDWKWNSISERHIHFKNQQNVFHLLVYKKLIIPMEFKDLKIILDYFNPFFPSK